MLLLFSYLVQADQLRPAAFTGTVVWKETQCQLTLDIHRLFNQNSPLIFISATDKVALLIGNLNYSNHIKLMAPIMDVHELSNLLQQLGFRVVSLLDLTMEEMLAAIDKFIQLLDRGVYGEHNFFFYISY